MALVPSVVTEPFAPCVTETTVRGSPSGSESFKQHVPSRGLVLGRAEDVVVGDGRIVHGLYGDVDHGRCGAGIPVVRAEDETVGPVIIPVRCVGDSGACGRHLCETGQRAVRWAVHNRECQRFAIGIAAGQNDRQSGVLLSHQRLAVGFRGVVVSYDTAAVPNRNVGAVLALPFADSGDNRHGIALRNALLSG